MLSQDIDLAQSGYEKSTNALKDIRNTPSRKLEDYMKSLAVAKLSISKPYENQSSHFEHKQKSLKHNNSIKSFADLMDCDFTPQLKSLGKKLEHIKSSQTMLNQKIKH